MSKMTLDEVMKWAGADFDKGQWVMNDKVIGGLAFLILQEIWLTQDMLKAVGSHLDTKVRRNTAPSRKLRKPTRDTKGNV